jgi:hypothetical protein
MARGTRFAQLRTAAFARVLRGAGHSVRLVYLSVDGHKTQGMIGPSSFGSGREDEWEGEWELEPGRLREALDGQSPEVLVSAGPFHAGAASFALRDLAPWFADLPGDPFAELAAARALRGGELREREADFAREVALRVLCGADCVGVISEGQRLAALGQLGLVGRDLEEAARLVRVVPISTPDGPPVHERGLSDQLGLVVGGARNGWQDGVGTRKLILAGLEHYSWLQVEITGDGLPGLAPEELVARFGGRVRIHGELTDADVQGLWARCGVALSLDRPIVETELGSRTRLIHWAWAGLEVMGGPGTELGRTLVENQGMWAADPDDVGGFLRALSQIRAGNRKVSQAQRVLQRDYRPETALSGVLDFVQEPYRSTPGREQQVGLLREIKDLRDELGGIRGSPTWRLLDHIRRRLPGSSGEG